MVDRLFAIMLIQVLRHLMETGQIHRHSGLLAGMSHPKLCKALVAMHEQPAQEWSLEALAHMTGMSRSIFASTFKATVGSTTGVYLQAWWVRLAQKALLQGRQLKVIAGDVGCGSEAALSRAFKAQCGLAPREWRHARHTDCIQPIACATNSVSVNCSNLATLPVSRRQTCATLACMAFPVAR